MGCQYNWRYKQCKMEFVKGHSFNRSKQCFFNIIKFFISNYFYKLSIFSTY
jgi:hypothetical protein